jgi:microcystin-dependent protein
MADPFVGQIITVAFKAPPKGWLACDGTGYDMSQYPVLFNLLGFTYGGGGTSFNVPDLRGRLVICQGQGPGLSDYGLGETGGAESVTLTLDQIEPHRHALKAINLPGAPTPPLPPPQPPYPPGPGSTYLLAQNTQALVNMYRPGPPNVALGGTSIDVYRGRGQPHENRQPFLAINYIICAEGILPPRT